MDLLIWIVLLVMCIADIFFIWSCFRLEQDYDLLYDEVFGYDEDENEQWNECETEERQEIIE